MMSGLFCRGSSVKLYLRRPAGFSVLVSNTDVSMGEDDELVDNGWPSGKCGSVDWERQRRRVDSAVTFHPTPVDLSALDWRNLSKGLQPQSRTLWASVCCWGLLCVILALDEIRIAVPELEARGSNGGKLASKSSLAGLGVDVIRGLEEGCLITGSKLGSSQSDAGDLGLSVGVELRGFHLLRWLERRGIAHEPIEGPR